MPKILVALDTAVDACYRTKAFKSELERLEFLFDLYRQYSEPMAQALDETKKKKKSK